MIDIQIRQSKNLPGIKNAFITFKEYNQELINSVRNFNDRRYNPDDKSWEISLHDLELFIAIAKDYPIEIHYQQSKQTFLDIPKEHKFKTKPLSHQLDGILYGLNHECFILADDQGLGKALSLNTKIYTPEGYKLMRDISVGDAVFNERGEVVTVLATYNHYNVEMYKITFSDGKSIECCKDHLWQYYNNHNAVKINRTEDIFKYKNGKIKSLKNKWGYNYRIPITKPVQFSHKNIFINPYVLGILIGDGCLINDCSFSTKDFEIAEKVKRLLPADCSLVHDGEITYRLVHNGKCKYNPFKQELKRLGLYNKHSFEKFIPNEYLFNDVETRLELVRGLLDSDGYASKCNLLQFTTTSAKLCEDFELLIESLGGLASSHIYTSKYTGKQCKDAYTVTIKIDDPANLVSLERKKHRLSYRHFKPRRNIVSIEKIDNQDAKCITVSGESHLYLAEHFIVTHNTYQTTNLAAIRKTRGEVTQCLIICGVNSIKYNWLEEIKTHTNETGFVLGTRYRKNGKAFEGTVSDRVDDLKTHKEFFLITNLETLRSDDFIKQLKKSKTIQMIVLDECHFCKNVSSSQGNGLQKLKDFKYKIAMSGTPLVNRPLDLYSSLAWLGLEKSNFSTFKNYYCTFGGVGGHTMLGYRNLDRLREQLKNNMLRRLKKEVLDLPEKTEKVEYIEMNKKQWQIYNEMRDEALENIDLIAASNNPLSMLLRLRQATGDTSILSTTIQESAKIERLKEIVYELSCSGRKCIVFSNWTQMTTRIKDALKQYNPAYITGEVNNADRQSEVQRFQTDDKCQVIIGTIGAMGTGLTLTAADTVIFTDLPWHRAAYDQCSDRAYRIGQKNNVQIITMIAKDTIDESILGIVRRKGQMADMLVDGKVSKLTRAELLDIIR